MKTCETCRWYRGFQGKNDGRCHRNPPQYRVHLIVYGIGWTSSHFPEVKSDDFCGEHHPKEPGHE